MKNVRWLKLPKELCLDHPHPSHSPSLARKVTSRSFKLSPILLPRPFKAFLGLLDLLNPNCSASIRNNILHLGPVHTTLKEFENGGFTMKTHQTFTVHTTPEKFKNATITGHFVFVFVENSVGEITWLSRLHRLRKAPFSKCFPSTRKRKGGVFKFLRFEERFRNAPFSWRISVDGRLNRRHKAAFSNFSSVVQPLRKIIKTKSDRKSSNFRF